jgi:hypothetical protein
MTSRTIEAMNELESLRSYYDAAFAEYAREARSLQLLATETGADALTLMVAEKKLERAAEKYRERRNAIANRLLCDSLPVAATSSRACTCAAGRT